MKGVHHLFYFHGDSCDHQYHFVGTLRYILVHPAFQIGEFPLQKMVAYAAASDFVCYKDKRRLLSGETVKFIF